MYQYIKIEIVLPSKEIQERMIEESINKQEIICMLSDNRIRTISEEKLNQKGLVYLLKISGKERVITFSEVMTFQNPKTLKLFIDRECSEI